MSAAPPQNVLTDAIVDAIGDSYVSAAVFVTYQLQPTFFEDHILAALLSLDNRGNPRVRRMLLEERLRGVDTLVLYDRHAMEPDGPLRQAVRAIPVDRSRGLLHAKHVLLLTKADKDDARASSLVFVTTSANLTRSGWWENVEVADVRVIQAGTESSLAADLLTLGGDLELLAGTPTAALTSIRTFVSGLRPAAGLPRLWLGRESLPAFLRSHNVPTGGQLELVAPFVGPDGRVVERLITELKPNVCRVFLPLARDESAAASAEWFSDVDGSGAVLCKLHDVDRSLGRGEGTRFVHAKAIRVLTKTKAWELVGSPNLTDAAHGGWRSQPGTNVETAILDYGSQPGAWLTALPTSERKAPSDTSLTDLREPGIALRLRINWEQPVAAEALLPQGEPPQRVFIGPGVQTQPPTKRIDLSLSVPGEWQDLTPEQVDVLQQELNGTNVLTAWVDGQEPRAFLVEELGLAFRKSRVFADLTAADILKHWSLLSPERRAAHAESALGESALDGGEVGVLTATQGERTASFFDDTAGMVHAFLMLDGRLKQAIQAQQPAVLTDILLGERHDSLGPFLDKVAETYEDPVRRVLIAESACALLDRFATYPAVTEHPAAREQLTARIETLRSSWKDLDLADDNAFRAWYQSQWGQR